MWSRTCLGIFICPDYQLWNSKSTETLAEDNIRSLRISCSNFLKILSFFVFISQFSDLTGFFSNGRVCTCTYMSVGPSNRSRVACRENSIIQSRVLRLRYQVSLRLINNYNYTRRSIHPMQAQANKLRKNCFEEIYSKKKNNTRIFRLYLLYTLEIQVVSIFSFRLSVSTPDAVACHLIT